MRRHFAEDFVRVHDDNWRIAQNHREILVGIADVSRRLLGAAYPDRDRSWIEERVALAGQRVGGMESASSTAPAPVMPASTCGRRVLPWSAGVVVLAAVVAVGTTQRKWFAETALSQNGVYTLIAGTALTGVVVGRVSGAGRRPGPTAGGRSCPGRPGSSR